jgi:hypothetical protein
MELDQPPLERRREPSCSSRETYYRRQHPSDDSTQTKKTRTSHHQTDLLRRVCHEVVAQNLLPSAYDVNAAKQEELISIQAASPFVRSKTSSRTPHPFSLHGPSDGTDEGGGPPASCPRGLQNAPPRRLGLVDRGDQGDVVRDDLQARRTDDHGGCARSGKTLDQVAVATVSASGFDAHSTSLLASQPTTD